MKCVETVDYTMRTMEGLKGTQLATAAQRKGKVNEPLLHIPLKNVVPDELHLMLRITDVLTRNLIRAAIKYDSAKNSRISNVLRRPMIARLLKEINSCGVSFTIRIKKDEFEFTSLVGNDKKKLLDNLPYKMSSCQPPEYYTIVQELWKVAIATYLAATSNKISSFRILLHCMK